ncbi:hypothetical protein M9458_044615, partial [Cirrhinus mrigala]
GSVQKGRVQVRGGVRRPHSLPAEVRGTRGSGFIHLSSRHFLRRVNRTGILAHSRLGAASRPDRGSGSSSIISASLDPSTLSSWTHEETSVHAR